MIQTGTRPIYDEIQKTLLLQSKTKNLEAKLSLANYIHDLYEALDSMGEENLRFPKYAPYGGRQHFDKINGLFRCYEKLVIDSFLENKDFHHQYFKEVEQDVGKKLEPLWPIPDYEDDTLSDVSFYRILYSFLEEYDLDSLFRKLDKDGKTLAFSVSPFEGKSGFTSYNPMTSNTFLFVKDAQFGLSTMHTLVHEFGHSYDLGRIGVNPLAYNQYFYLSLYSEVLPRMFERLFLRYCMKNGIHPDAVRGKFLDFESLNYDYLLWGSVLCSLEDNFFRKHKDLNYQIDKIVRKIGSQYTDPDALSESLHSCPNFDIHEILTYSYGDIVSLFLADDVEENRFDSEMLEYFMRNRVGVFQENFLRECGFGPADYMKHYETELQYFKK